jgi:DNA polymerase-3 subunit epsilon
VHRVIDDLSLQLTLADAGTSLAEAVFVVVDLETTGGAPAEAGITEIGAVKMQGGEVIGEFSTLVNPGVPIPPFIASLTGITNATVASAPRLATALPAFLEFAGDSILVAHNAPYDIGFLKGACALHDQPWRSNRVLDTARLARVILHRDEVRNCKLATLSAYFRTSVSPTHRAFDDARATADVLHRLIERAGNLGVYSVEDLQALSGRVTTTQRTKRHLADGMPAKPGVYVFNDPQGKALYVGTSRNIRTRVRSYFTASEQRRRMSEMIGIAVSVTPIVCATALEARVRELRLIHEQQPRYNRASRRADTKPWVKLTAETAPRLSIVSTVADDIDDGAMYLGPFSSRSAANSAIEALMCAFPVRTCTPKLARSPRAESAGCIRFELGTCAAPCMKDGGHADYALTIERVRRAFAGDAREVVRAVEQRMLELSAETRFEDAATWRDYLATFSRISMRTHAVRMLATNAEVIAARPTDERGWEIHCIRFGSLAGAITVEPGVDPRPSVEILADSASVFARPATPVPVGLIEETTELLGWLESEGTRLVRVSEPLSLPMNCGGDAAAHLLNVQKRMQRSSLHDADFAWMSRYSRPAGPRTTSTVSRIGSAS